MKTPQQILNNETLESIFNENLVNSENQQSEININNSINNMENNLITDPNVDLTDIINPLLKENLHENNLHENIGNIIEVISNLF